MSRNEHRITETAIEAEMIRLASLLAVHIKPSKTRAGVIWREVRAARTLPGQTAFAFAATL